MYTETLVVAFYLFPSRASFSTTVQTYHPGPHRRECVDQMGGWDTQSCGVCSLILSVLGCFQRYRAEHRKRHNITPRPGRAIFKARLLRTQHDSNTKRQVFGKLFARSFQTAPVSVEL